MITCATDANDRETSNNHGNRERDHHLHDAETIGVAEGLCFHNLLLADLSFVLAGPEGLRLRTARQWLCQHRRTAVFL